MIIIYIGIDRGSDSLLLDINILIPVNYSINATHYLVTSFVLNLHQVYAFS